MKSKKRELEFLIEWRLYDTWPYKKRGIWIAWIYEGVWSIQGFVSVRDCSFKHILYNARLLKRRLQKGISEVEK